MRYAIRALFIPIPRWRCPALIKRLLATFGGECRCYISDPRVVRAAQTQGITRFNGRRRYRYRRGGEKQALCFR